jgi:hypothetical protein
MIRLGASELLPRYTAGSPQIRQLAFVTSSFCNLPDCIVREYQAIVRDADYPASPRTG